MLQYLVRRFLVALPVILGVTVLSFGIMNAAPGTIVDLFIDPNMTPEMRQLLVKEYGLDKPVHVRYVLWLKELARGNLGISFITKRPVAERIMERLGPTLLLTITSILFAYAFAIPIGVLSATRQYSAIDYGSTAFALVGNSFPGFFLGLVFIYLFSLRLDLFPTGGMMTLGQPFSPSDRLLHLVLPATVLATGFMGSVMRFVRSSMLEVVRQDYIRTARAKGLAQRIVIYKHALRNALMPVVTLFGLQFPFLLGGAIITEQVFAWPGMGRLAIEAVGSRDYPVLMGLNLIASILVVLGGLISDALYSVVDPRIRYS